MYNYVHALRSYCVHDMHTHLGSKSISHSNRTTAARDLRPQYIYRCGTWAFSMETCGTLGAAQRPL